MASRKGSITAYAIKVAAASLFFTIVAILCINFLVDRYSSMSIDVTSTHAQQLAWRLLDTMAYQNKYTRLKEPLVIDLDKMKKPDLVDGVKYPELRYAAKIDIDANILYYDERTFNLLLPQKNFEGPGGVKHYKFSYPVTLRKGDDMTSATAVVEVLALP